MTRIFYEVLPAPGGGWNITRDGKVVDSCTTKREAIDTATEQARVEWIDCTQPTSVRIKGRDGQIKDERTFGLDPHPPKG